MKDHLFAPTDVASLFFFRISLGLVFLVEAIRYFAKGWIQEYYIGPQFHFTYFGFEWVKPWPGWGMYAHFAVMALAALGVALGCFYRISAIICFLSFTYVFLLDQALYLNHFYLMCLLAFLMMFIPAHRAGSIDAWRNPTMCSDVIPAWPRVLLLSFLSLVYVYAGIAKLNFDWFTGDAMHLWLVGHARNIPVLGRVVHHQLTAQLFAYGGLAFDLLIVPLLLWRRTRIFGFIWAILFHFLNFLIFNIGVFPWLMMLATTLYFAPDWPRKVFRWRPGGQVAAFRYSPIPIRLGLAFLLIQVLVPLRHLVYPGEANWNEQGHRFSWHMMLRTKAGTATFVVTDPATRRSWAVEPDDFLTARQARQCPTRPDMMLQFAHYLARQQATLHKITNRLEVRVVSSVSLDRRSPQPLVYPDIDLTTVPRHLGRNDWITPLLGKDSATPEQLARMKAVPKIPPKEIQTPVRPLSQEELVALLSTDATAPPPPAPPNVLTGLFVSNIAVATNSPPATNSSPPAPRR